MWWLKGGFSLVFSPSLWFILCSLQSARKRAHYKLLHVPKYYQMLNSWNQTNVDLTMESNSTVCWGGWFFSCNIPRVYLSFWLLLHMLVYTTSHTSQGKFKLFEELKMVFWESFRAFQVIVCSCLGKGVVVNLYSLTVGRLERAVGRG